ncbi:hypothetical protein N0V93_004278 [Gnomoniopsis smithogilvyi]|uniref:Uncharacterized protein n=1 Tax=Gnomoniopsis smithogilvyi TaxID=1191159 RepID=A0A9W9CWY0_9PEZI|nr:hypothetical protein N0V93_004278 [Gnomoniopsis smithogilvyi]
MAQRSDRAGEAYPLLSVTTTTQTQNSLSSHSSYYSFEKDVEAGNVAEESGKDLTLIGAFLTAWDMSDNPGRVGLVIHALLVVAAVLGLLGLVLYMPFLAIMNMMNGTGGDG